MDTPHCISLICRCVSVVQLVGRWSQVISRAAIDKRQSFAISSYTATATFRGMACILARFVRVVVCSGVGLRRSMHVGAGVGDGKAAKRNLNLYWTVCHIAEIAVRPWPPEGPARDLFIVHVAVGRNNKNDLKSHGKCCRNACRIALTTSTEADYSSGCVGTKFLAFVGEKQR